MFMLAILDNKTLRFRALNNLLLLLHAIAQRLDARLIFLAQVLRLFVALRNRRLQRRNLIHGALVVEDGIRHDIEAVRLVPFRAHSIAQRLNGAQYLLHVHRFHAQLHDQEVAAQIGEQDAAVDVALHEARLVLVEMHLGVEPMRNLEAVPVGGLLSHAELLLLVLVLLQLLEQRLLLPHHTRLIRERSGFRGECAGNRATCTTTKFA
mmetsp:Transcript_1345/g.2628  ORF Transcript_1345/g.2628 Transcript_1345/m.2628 type:complete len:208 (-) Transcript_1345:499-1122(-)